MERNTVADLYVTFHDFFPDVKIDGLLNVDVCLALLVQFIHSTSV